MRRFEAHAKLSEALASLQAGEPAATIAAEVRRAAAHGLSWFTRPSSELGLHEVHLRHLAGAEIGAEGESITALLAGLLGHPLAQDWAPADADEPEEEATPDPAILSPAQAVAEHLAAKAALAAHKAQAAAESLAAATSGAVVADVVIDEEPDPATPLSDEQKAAAINGIKELTPQQQKICKKLFRDAFKVPETEKSVIPFITELRHLHFCDRFAIEANGGVAA